MTTVWKYLEPLPQRGLEPPQDIPKLPEGCGRCGHVGNLTLVRLLSTPFCVADDAREDESSSSTHDGDRRSSPEDILERNVDPAAMLQLVNWSKTPLSPDYRGSGSFATFMIIGGRSSGRPGGYVTTPSRGSREN